MKKNLNQVKFLLAVIAVVSIAFVSCSKDEEETPPTGTADFNVSLENSAAKKSSVSITSVNIDIQKVSIHTSADTSTNSGWYELEVNTGIYDLLDYESGNDTIIGFDPVITAQRISQIRLVLGSNNSVVDDGNTYPLETPSAQTSGLKIQVNADLQPNESYKVVLDFDSDKSVKKTGNDKYKLQPVIKAALVQL
jgi:hypothetical protein